MLTSTIISRDWKHIYFLIAISLVSSILSINISQTTGSSFFWIVLILLFIVYFLGNNYWNLFLVLITALSTLSVFRAGIELGYNLWSYLTIGLFIFLSLRIKTTYLSLPGLIWWVLLLCLGVFHLFFAEWEPGYIYSKFTLLKIATGLSMFAIAHELTVLRNFKDAVSQISFLVMSVCTISLIVPLYLSEKTRLGTGIGMDANGLGITAIYAFYSGLAYILFNEKKRSIYFFCIIVMFLVVVLVQTGSRQAITSCILLVGLYTILSIKKIFKLQYLLIIASIFIGLAYFVSETQISYLDARFNKAFGLEGKIDRLDHLKVSLYMVNDHPLGLGGGGFKEHFNEYKYKAGIISRFTNINPHTLFGMVLADWGIPGILLLAGGFISLFKYIFRLKEEAFIIKALAGILYVILANAGMVFPPIFMVYLGIINLKEGDNIR